MKVKIDIGTGKLTPFVVAGGGNSVEQVADPIKADTATPITAGDAPPTEPANTKKAGGLVKTASGSLKTSHEKAVGIEAKKPKNNNNYRVQNVLFQILTDSAMNLRDAGVMVKMSEGINKNGVPHVFFSIEGVKLCKECKWGFFGNSCGKRKCKAYQVEIQEETK